MNNQDNQDTKPFTVYRDWSGYGYQAGHVDMECKHSHVNCTENDDETMDSFVQVHEALNSNKQ